MLHLNEKDFTDDLLCASLRFQKRTGSIGYDGHMNMSTGVWSSGIKFYGQMKYGLPLTDIQELGSLGVQGKSGTRLVLLKEYKGKKGGYFGAVSMDIHGAQVYSGRKIGVPLIRSHTKHIQFLLFMDI